MSKKKIIFNLIVLFIVTALTIYYLFDSNLFKNINTLKSLTIPGIILIVTLIIIYVSSDSYIIYSSLKKTNKNAKLRDGYGAYLMGNLGSNITPWKAGHFPFAFYFYNKKKYSFEDTLTIVSRNHLVYSTCLIFFYFIFMIISLVYNFTVKISNFNIPLYLVALFGSLSNVLYIVAILILIKSKKAQTLLLKVQVFFYHKFHKDKDILAYKNEKILKMEVYSKCFYDYTKKFYTYLKPIFVYVIFMLANYGLPYIIYLMLSGKSFNITDYFYFFLLMQAMKYVSNIIPIPGGTGVTEYCFITVYTLAMGENYVTSALVVWRILTYFGLIIADFIYFLIFNSKKQIEEIQIIKHKEG